VGHQIAPGHLELGGEQRREGVHAHARVHGRGVDHPAGGGHRHERAARLVGQLDHHLLEGESVADAVADRLEERGHVARLGEPGRDLEHVLEHALVLGRRGHVLRDPDREGRVPRARHEGVDVGVARAPPALGLVHRHHAEELPAGAAERDEERILRLPGTGIVGGLDRRRVGAAGDPVPVELALRDEVGAAPLEPGGEQGHPGLAQRGLAEQQLDRLVRPHRRRGEHVIERRPVDVHDHGPVAERLADRVRHLPQHVLEVLVRAHRGGALEHRAKPSDHGQGSRV
jgi:hypothetical protein